MRLKLVISLLVAFWLALPPRCQAEFTMEMKSDEQQTPEPPEGATSEVPWHKDSEEPTEVNVQAPKLPEPNRNVDSYMNIDGSPDLVQGEDGRMRTGTQAATELNNEAVRRMNEGRFEEAKPMFEKARELMGDAPEGPVFEETQLNKFNRNVINQNVDTVFKYDANRYDKSGNQPSVQDILNLEPGADSSSDCGN